MRLLEIDIEFDDRRRERLVQPLPVGIGKDAQNGVRISHWRVAGVHARITALGDFLQIEDLRTFHGTRVNGIRVAQHYPLLASDEVSIGPARLRFQRRVDPQAVSEPGSESSPSAGVACLAGFDPTLRAALHAELFHRLDVSDR